MNLYSQRPYWLMKNGIINTFNSLKEDLSTDVAIIGAGISGALVAHTLCNTGMKIAMFDRRHAGCGSTAASTSFLQYEIDKPLRELQELVGKENALRSYKASIAAVHSLATICGRFKSEFEFCTKPSLQYASFKKDKSPLYEEYRLRKKHGFEVTWLDESELMEKFGIEAPGALFSAVGAEVDAYALTHNLLRVIKDNGHGIYNNTDIKHIEYGRGRVYLHTDKGLKITAKKLVIACGYESQKYIEKNIADVHTTYAIVSEPLGDKNFWHQNSLVWETANPYMYFRKVSGDKILVGGRDDEFHPPSITASAIKKKAKMLEEAFCRRVPHVPLTMDYSWCGAFAVTKDGLPYIGTIPEKPNTYFALGYGGNGITFSAIAADIIKDMITGKKNEDAELFRFDR